MAREEKVFVRGHGEKVAYPVTEVVARTRTKFQQVEILRTEPYGLSVFLDGDPQSSADDEFIYHEALVHPAMLCAAEPRRVFIAGGGEGATLREVLRHNTVQRVVMVDIDAEAVQLFRQHLTTWHQGAFADPRVELRHEDARGYLAASGELFDCIVVDVTDPLLSTPARLLFTEEFYRLAASRLTPLGAIATQAESFAYNDLGAHLSIAKTMARVFPYVLSYGVNVPFYADAWGFAVGSRVVNPAELAPWEVDARLAERGCGGLRFYDGETHRALAHRPKYYREMLAAWQRIIRDDQPVSRER